VIWRKLDCLNPNLQKVQVVTRRKTPETGVAPFCRLMKYLQEASGGGAMSSEDIQGDEWDAYVTLATYSRDERGIA
jgi:hypothetical protein